MKQRVELHTHTNMSEFDGICTADEYIEEASRQGMNAIAITDHCVVRGFPEAYRAAQRSGIKLIYGMEGCFVDDLSCYNDCSNITIIVQNEIGLKNLYRLVTKSHIEHFHKQPVLSRDELIQFHEGLLYGTAAFRGELYSAILGNRSEQALNKIADFYDFFELQPIDNEDCKYAPDELRDICKRIVALGEKQNKPIIATCDAHYVFPDDKEAYKIWQWNKGNENYDKMPDLYLKTTDEMLEEFSYLGKENAYEIVVDSTNRIADSIESFPPIPDEKAYPIIENAENTICTLANDKLKELYGQKPHQIIKERLEWELDAICKNRYASQYLVAKNVADKSKSLGYPVGSRGTVGSSFVAYLIGISEINPLPPHYHCLKCNYTEFYKNKFCGADMEKKLCPKCGTELYRDGYNIPAEMFMGIDGSKEPDIDFNVSEDVRDKCLQALKEHIIRAGTIGNYSSRSADILYTIYCHKTNCNHSPEEKMSIINKLTNITKLNGLHPGGEMLIAKDKDLLDYTPVQYGRNEAKFGYTTHFDFHSLDDKILKFDILYHNDMTRLKRLEDMTGQKYNNIPLDDKATFEMIANGEADYTEFSSEWVKDNIISVIKPGCMDDLIRISAVSHSTGVWTDNAEINMCVNDVKLSEVISSRDDIMIFLMKCGYAREKAYEIAEKVRKGKGLSEEEYREMLDNSNIPDWYPESCNKIKYLFPRSHAAVYTLNSYRIAYYKAHYPNDFKKICQI